MYSGFHDRVVILRGVFSFEGVNHTVKKVVKTVGVLGRNFEDPQIFTPQWQSERLMVRIENEVMTINAVPVVESPEDPEVVAKRNLEAKAKVELEAEVEKRLLERVREIMGTLEKKALPEAPIPTLQDLQKLVDNRKNLVSLWTTLVRDNANKRLEVRCCEYHVHSAPDCVEGDVRDVVIAMLCDQLQRERDAVRKAFELQGVDV